MTGIFSLASRGAGRHFHGMPDQTPTVAPQIMGIVNVTPDSFSDGGRHLEPAIAIEHGRRLVRDGADILDIGGESTRPGADAVSVEEELRRILPVIKGLSGAAAAISVDTRKPAVARAAMAEGAVIWNDVSALSHDAESLAAAAALGCRVVLMHAQGDPKTMQNDPYYDDVVADVYAYLESRIDACVDAGVERRNIIIDPGIGFGKTLAHNLALMARLDQFSSLGAPLLLGASRKRFIAALDDSAGGADDALAKRLGGSLAAVIEGWRRGAAIFRVHDVFETRQALKIANAIELA